jgi:predicted PurR-regulated permease PerM
LGVYAVDPIASMTADESSSPLSKFAAFATFCLVVGMLHWAKEIVIPLALAALLAFLLSPLVARLIHWGLGRTLAVILASILGLGAFGGIGWIVTQQTLNVVQALPKYEKNIEMKIRRLREPHTPTALAQAATMVEKIQKDLKASDGATPAAGAGDRAAPVPVEVEPARSSMFDMGSALLGAVLGPLGTAAIVMVFVVAMLLHREDLRSRFIMLSSTGSLNVATQALDDAAQRVSRYLTMQLVVNASYGVPVGLGLWAIGIPNAALWGFLSTLLRFIPYLGPWLAAACPLALAVAIDPGWNKLLLTLGLFVLAEAVTANIIEVWAYGVRTGISSFALMVAAVFWTWLWGPVGLFLSTPLTVCLMVLGKHLPGLSIFGTLLSSEPVLQPPALLYERMLAMDADEMLVQALKCVEDSSLAEFYNDVFIPALIMSEEDRHSGTLAEVRQKFIFQASRELIMELQRRSAQAERLASPPSGARPDHPWVVLGIPARDEADELAALMVQHLLHERGIRVEVCPAVTVPAEFIAQFNPDDIRIAFVSALPPATLVAARQVSRHLREHSPGLTLIIGVWSGEADPGKLKSRLRNLEPSEVVTRLTDAVLQIERLGRGEGKAAPETPAAGESPLAPAGERRPGLRDAAPEDWCDTVVRDLAQAFDVPTSLVTIVNQDQQFWKSRGMRMPGFAYSPDAPREAFLFGLGATSSDLVVVEDVAKEPRFAANAFLHERGVRFFAVMPLRTAQGRTIACLCVIDTKPRQISPECRDYFRQRVAELMEALLSLPEATEPVPVRVGRVD